MSDFYDRINLLMTNKSDYYLLAIVALEVQFK
jgi:hypothetical protein